MLLLFASTSSFPNVDDDKKKQEEEEVVLLTRLLDVVEDEVRCPEPPAGTFNISFFLKRARKKRMEEFITYNRYPLELLPPQSDFQRAKNFSTKIFALSVDWVGRRSRGYFCLCNETIYSQHKIEENF